jgi:hypothetical protein
VFGVPGEEGEEGARSIASGIRLPLVSTCVLLEDIISPTSSSPSGPSNEGASAAGAPTVRGVSQEEERLLQALLESFAPPVPDVPPVD